jgi:hypothetical protein
MSDNCSKEEAIRKMWSKGFYCQLDTKKFKTFNVDLECTNDGWKLTINTIEYVKRDWWWPLLTWGTLLEKVIILQCKI